MGTRQNTPQKSNSNRIQAAPKFLNALYKEVKEYMWDNPDGTINYDLPSMIKILDYSQIKEHEVIVGEWLYDRKSLIKDSKASSGEKSSKEYPIERIITQKIDTDGIEKYKIRWEGYKASCDTWEPVETIRNDNFDIVRAYEKKVEDDGKKADNDGKKNKSNPKKLAVKTI